MAIQSDGPAPYTSIPALLAVIDGFRERGLQTPFTHDVLIKAGVPETLAPRTLQALILLDLITEDGNPTDTLIALRKAPADEYQQHLAEFVRAAYAEVFTFADPANDSRERVRDAFRSYTPVGQQDRMVALFLGLCAHAGLIDEAPRARRPRTATQHPAQRANRSNGNGRRQSRGGKSPPPPPADFAPSPPPNTGQHPFVSGLLQSLPPVGSVWNDQKRQDWVNAALAAFNIIYERAPDDSQDSVTNQEDDPD